MVRGVEEGSESDPGLGALACATGLHGTSFGGPLGSARKTRDALLANRFVQKTIWIAGHESLRNMDRSRALQVLRHSPEISVLVVGAGINGIGTFRDLSLNGVDVLLIDRSDFCSGASAASSHMAHGGIRYLENGEFRLVREAVRERNAMITNAPHIVRPLPTTIPIFRRLSGLLNAPLKFLGLLDRPSERGALVIKLGLILYDAFAGAQRTVPRHRFLGRKESIRRWNKLNPAVVNTATYYDGAILQPERLGLELVLDAEAANDHATALNYLRLQRYEDQSLVLCDELSGELFRVKPLILVNATGPWIDLSNQAIGFPTRFIGGTKGSHIVLDHPELRQAIGEHEFFFENQDGRIVLIFPLYDRVLVGTSDLPSPDPDAALATEAEVDYFIELVKRVFPKIVLDRSHIVFRFSGVRPLAASKSKTAAQITRDHEIQVLPPSRTRLPFPIYSLVGGKWTSWRAFSEQATDECLRFLRRNRVVETKALRIGGGRGYPMAGEPRRQMLSEIADRFGGSAERAADLLERYGTRALPIADFMAGGKDAPLASLPDYSHREFEFIATNEKVVHLDDVLLRRSLLAMLGRATGQAIEEVAQVLAGPLGWDPGRQQAELARTREILKNRHQVDL
jgi:glycerol-3-phosphate dehydrogenase